MLSGLIVLLLKLSSILRIGLDTESANLRGAQRFSRGQAVGGSSEDLECKKNRVSAWASGIHGVVRWGRATVAV